MPSRQKLLTTLTVSESDVGATADGATALLLTTKEQGTIAFRIDLTSIAILRRELVKAETILLRAQNQTRQ